MPKIDFDLAVDMLDKYIQTKTVHGVNGIKEKMQDICSRDFESNDDYQDFANICSNFEKYCAITKTTSFGRNQFEVLFEQGFDFPDSKEAALKMLEPQEDTLPEEMFEDDKERIVHLEKELEKAQRKIEEYEDCFRQMRELLNPWA